MIAQTLDSKELVRTGCITILGREPRLRVNGFAKSFKSCYLNKGLVAEKHCRCAPLGGLYTRERADSSERFEDWNGEAEVGVMTMAVPVKRDA